MPLSTTYLMFFEAAIFLDKQPQNIQVLIYKLPAHFRFGKVATKAILNSQFGNSGPGGGDYSWQLKRQRKSQRKQQKRSPANNFFCVVFDQTQLINSGFTGFN